MSQDNVKLFFKELEKNEALQEKLGNIKHEEDFIAAANEAGFSFDLEHLHAYQIELRKTRSAALSDDEIANVTGGGPGQLHVVTDDDGYNTAGYLIKSVYEYCNHWTHNPIRSWKYSSMCFGCDHFILGPDGYFGYCLEYKRP
jgi:predicted ribosomally synthesized peptide with nif11-like leader